METPGETDGTDNMGGEETAMNIAEFVANNDNYSTLLAAVEYAGLGDALANEDSELTVFAPDNAAFETWLNGAALDSFTPEEVAQVLLNHIIGAELNAETVSGAVPTYQSTLATGPSNLAGEATNVSIFIDEDLTINGESDITGADAFDASNGIIHAVSSVINLPNISTFAIADSRLSTLTEALVAQELVGTVDSFNPATVLAPLNSAFSALDAVPAGEALTSVLTYHVISGVNAVASDVIGLEETPATVQGQTIAVTLLDDSPAFMGNANAEAASVVIADIQAVNGVVHVIDTVLLPSE